MAVLYIAEYSSHVLRDPPLVEQVMRIGASSIQSGPFSAATRFIRVHSDSSCSVTIGTDPMATMGNGRMAANQTEYRRVPAGCKIAVIRNS